MQPEDNPLVEKIINKNANSENEIEKIDDELDECRLKLLSTNTRGEALEVVKRRINELLDKRLAWMNDDIKKNENIEKKEPTLKNKKRIIRLMRRRLR